MICGRGRSGSKATGCGLKPDDCRLKETREDKAEAVSRCWSMSEARGPFRFCKKAESKGSRPKKKTSNKNTTGPISYEASAVNNRHAVLLDVWPYWF